MTTKKKFLVLCPTHRDLRELPRLSDENEFIFFGDDVSEKPDMFDAEAFLHQIGREFSDINISGVIATDDYPGSLLASVIAKNRSLPGPDPRLLLQMQHKFVSRQIQQACVPNAVPRFALVDLECKEPPLPFPFFLKPVKSFFSILADEIINSHAFDSAIKSASKHLSGFVRPFHYLVENYSDIKVRSDFLLAEELLSGHQVTLEGYVVNKKIITLGVVDSIMYPNTRCFEQFRFPSKLSEKIQNRMHDIAAELITFLGLDQTLFNIEMIYNAEKDSIHIIEVNPRMCSQFADLFEKVHGINTYSILLALAAGQEPKWQKMKGAFSVATSFVLRRFRDASVVTLPTKNEIENLSQDLPDIRVEVFGRVGERLSSEMQDGKSYRYGIINLGGKSESELNEKFNESLSRLKFQFLE